MKPSKLFMIIVALFCVMFLLLKIVDSKLATTTSTKMRSTTTTITIRPTTTRPTTTTATRPTTTTTTRPTTTTTTTRPTTTTTTTRPTTTTTTTRPTPDDDYNTNNFVWAEAGNGCGSKIPEPTLPYEINASSTYISAEVHNITEDDFYDYVGSCCDYGFDGSVGSASSPNLYFMGYNLQGYYLQVFYYEEAEYFSIYIRPPSSTSDNSNDDTSNDNEEYPSAIGTYKMSNYILNIYTDGTLYLSYNGEYMDIEGTWTQSENTICYSVWNIDGFEWNNPFCDTVYDNGIDFLGDFYSRIASSDTNDSTDTTNNDLLFAKNLAEQLHLSEVETQTMLVEKGYSLTQAVELTENCGVNWNQQATYRAEEFTDYYAMVSPVMIAELLADCEFTADNISYAVQNANIDWEFYATKHAEEYVLIAESQNEYLTPLSVKAYLGWEKGYCVLWEEYVFDKYEYCEVALENLSINWNVKALEYIDYIDRDGELAEKSSYVFWLSEEEFTQSQIDYALENCDNDWYRKAVICLKHFVENLCSDTPSQRECKEQLAEWGFNDDEIAYAIEECGYLLDSTSKDDPRYLEYTYDSDSKTYIITGVGEFHGENLVIPSTYNRIKVSAIGSDAFYDCTFLVSVIIPDSVITIGEYAFWGCTSLTSVTIGDYVTSIGNLAFRDCTSLTSVIIGNSVSNIGECAFECCTSLTNISIPASVTCIDNFAFRDCSSLISITIPDSVTSIGFDTFYGCTSLTSVTIGNSVTSIQECTFYDCVSLVSVTIPDSVTSIGEYAFYNCTSLANVFYEGDVENWLGISFDEWNSNPIHYATNLYFNDELVTNITIPNTVTSIPDDAFYGCASLISVTIPNSVTSIGDSAFYRCTSLTSITMGDSVTSIGDDAFYGCTSLASVTIPNSVNRIGAWAFSGCILLADVVFETTESWWYASNSSATSGTSISSANLSNSAIAATYLSYTYQGYYWNRATTSSNITPTPDNQGSSSSPEEDVQMVWIPSTGSKYHANATCSSMTNPQYVPLEDAKKMGYTACKKCYSH